MNRFERGKDPKEVLKLGLEKILHELLMEIFEHSPEWLAYSKESEVEEMLTKKLGHPVRFKKTYKKENEILLQAFLKKNK